MEKNIYVKVAFHRRFSYYFEIRNGPFGKNNEPVKDSELFDVLGCRGCEFCLLNDGSGVHLEKIDKTESRRCGLLKLFENIYDAPCMQKFGEQFKRMEIKNNGV